MTTQTAPDQMTPDLSEPTRTMSGADRLLRGAILTFTMLFTNVIFMAVYAKVAVACQGIFESTGGDLPFLVMLGLTLANFFLIHWYVYVPIFFLIYAAIFALLYAQREPKFIRTTTLILISIKLLLLTAGLLSLAHFVVLASSEG